MSEKPQESCVICITSKTPLTYPEVASFPRAPLNSDWYGEKVTPPISYTLATDPDAVWLLGSRAASPQCDLSLETGAFVEGLWEQELIELFICDSTPSSTRYQEFNLSPTGAWWTAIFDDYRMRSESVDLLKLTSGVQCWSEVSKNEAHWHATIRIPRSALGIRAFDERPTRANVTSILSSPASDTHLFLSASNLQSIAPDFHRASLFKEVRAHLR